MAWRDDDVRHVVELATLGHLEDRMLMSTRQRLVETRGGNHVAVLGFHHACSCWLDGDGLAVDANLTVADADAVAWQSDHAFDPNLRAVARPAEDDHIASL